MALKLDPKFAGAYWGRGDCYLAQARFEQAIEEFSAALRADKDYERACALCSSLTLTASPPYTYQASFPLCSPCRGPYQLLLFRQSVLWVVWLCGTFQSVSSSVCLMMWRCHGFRLRARRVLPLQDDAPQGRA